MLNTHIVIVSNLECMELYLQFHIQIYVVDSNRHNEKFTASFFIVRKVNLVLTIHIRI